MKKNLLFLFLSWFIALAANALPPMYVPPPPTHTFPSPPGVYVPPPQAMQIKFANGASVAIFRDRFVLIEPDGRQYTKRRPLPDLARNPYGCAWLRNYLDNTSPYTRDWGDHCQVYLEWCLGLR